MSWFEPRYHAEPYNTHHWQGERAAYGPIEIHVLSGDPLYSVQREVNDFLARRDIAVLAVSPAMPGWEYNDGGGFSAHYDQTWTVSILFQRVLPTGIPADEEGGEG